MSFIRSRRGAVVLALVVVGLVATLSAAGDNSGNPAILQAVQALQSTVNSLATAVSELTTTVNNINTATTPGNTLFTPSLFVHSPDDLICTVTNVSSAPRNVTVQLIDSTAAVVVEFTGAVNPGSSASVTGVTNLGQSFRDFCKITVNDGVKTDVRGVLAMLSPQPVGVFQIERDPIGAQ